MTALTFYEETLRNLIRNGVMKIDDSVLVVCGGGFDAEVMTAVGLKQVLITNLDDRYDGYCAPFEWQYADVEALAIADQSFDWVIEHAGLHHCASPHLALIEMVRVARKGALAFESRDSTMMRTAVRLGFTSEYEIESVVLDRDGAGGQRNTGIPNFVYRWTEREVRKTVESAFPDRHNDVRFFYGLAVPFQRLAMSGSIKRTAAQALGLALSGVFKLLPTQGNQFAFAVLKGDKCKPWITRDEAGTHLNPSYHLGFDPAKYRRPSPKSIEDLDN